MIVVAVPALILVPFAASYRDNFMWRARQAHAAELARGYLQANDWGIPGESLQAFPAGANAFQVYFQSVEDRPVKPEIIIVPHEQNEPMIVLLNEIGPHSGDRSRILVAKDDFRIIEEIQAE